MSLLTVADSRLVDGAKLAALPAVAVAPNDATKYLNGTGAWSVPAGSGAVTSVFGRVGAVTAQTGDYNSTNVGLGNVENTALSTWAGTASITTLGTISTGTWNATAIADGKIASALTGKSVNGVTLSTAAGATNFLAGDGTYKTATSSTPKMLLATDFTTAGRYTATNSGSGANTYTINGAELTTGNTITSSSYLKWYVSQGNNQIELGSPSFSFFSQFIAKGTDGTIIFVMGNPSISGGLFDLTIRHAGFKIVWSASGTASLYATQADGATENASSALTTVVSNDTLDLIVKINSTTSIDYYWRKNGSALSSATNLTSNMPVNFMSGLEIGVSNNGVATTNTFWCFGAHYER